MSKRHSRKKIRDTRLASYRHPRWWPTWLAMGCIWLLAQLPMQLQWRLGKLIGDLAYFFMRRRRHITETNIALCFPELEPAQQRALVRRTFRSNGIGLMEVGSAWFRNPESLRRFTRVHGQEHLEDAFKHGRGILLLGGHYSTLDLGGSLISLFIEADVMQRDHNNSLVNAIMTRSREQRYGVALDRRDLRGLFKRLRMNRTVWYAPDQDYGRRGSVFAPFFGVPAASITATARIAQSSGCVVIPFSHFRSEQGLGYDIYFLPALSPFPSGDEMTDASLVNATIEAQVRQHPDQYLWMHRRFKTRPNPTDPNPYRQPSAYLAAVPGGRPQNERLPHE